MPGQITPISSGLAARLRPATALLREAGQSVTASTAAAIDAATATVHNTRSPARSRRHDGFSAHRRGNHRAGCLDGSAAATIR